MIETTKPKSSAEELEFFLKREAKAKKKEKTKRKSGTNFNEYGYNLISRIQISLFCISLALIPISLFPLEWNMFEYGRAFILIFFTILLLTFELIKFFIEGKVEVSKSPRDVIFLLLAFSFFVSLVFSADSFISFWGYEYRFGTGMVSILTMLIYILILKSTTRNFKTLVTLISFLNIGFLFSAILSIFSFYGINIFGIIPEFEKFFLLGLPLFNSLKLSIGLWSVSILLSLFVYYYYFKIFSNDEAYLNKKISLVNAYRKKRAIQTFLSLAFVSFTTIFLVAISLFSIKAGIWSGVFSLGMASLIFLFLTFLSGAKILKYMTAIFLFLVILTFGSVRLPVVQDVLSISSERLVEQVTLGNEAIWGIAISSLSDSLPRALVGLGNDNFVVAYNLYRPAFSGDVDLNFVNYSYANNEIYNIVSNRGILGLFIWLVVGFIIARQFLQYLTDGSRKQLLRADSIENVAILLLDLSLIYIWLFAFFAYYSFILYFVFFFVLVLSTLFKNISYKMNSETLVIQTNFFVEKVGQVRSDTLPKFFIILVCIASVYGMYALLTDFVSRIDAVKAESILHDMYEPDEAKFQVAMEHYDEAIAKSPNNYVFRRKVSLVLLDYVNKILAPDFANLTEESERQEYVRILGVYGDTAIDQSKKATDLAPMVAVNWNNRDLIYSDLVRIGFQNYMNTAIKVSEQAIMRNPNNYNPYINKATYLYLSGDAGGAISYSRQALEINPYNIAALVLAGEVSLGLQDYVNAKIYLERVYSLLEGLDLRQPEVFNLYEQVERNLEYLWSLEVGEPVEEIELEEETLVLPDDEISD